MPFIGNRKMESHIGIFNLKGHFDPNESLFLFKDNISKEQLLDKLLFFIKAIVEYIFGTYMGYTIGWLMGLFVGNSYIEHFEPVYLDDLSQLSYWRLLPYEFARNIAIIGSIMGVITIIVWRQL